MLVGCVRKTFFILGNMYEFIGYASFEMWLFEFDLFELSPEKQYAHCAYKQNKQE